jgi:hypothetical protein
MYKEGTVWYDPDTGDEYRVAEIEHKYVLTKYSTDSDGEEVDHTRLRYPEAVLHDKLERGELEPVEAQEQDTDDQDGFECDECGEVVDTKQGLKSHQAQVH